MISELSKVKTTQSEAVKPVLEAAKTVFGKIKATNLLKSRKTCEKRQLNISELAEVDQKIMSFGKFFSGQNLGNYVSVSNKSKQEQTFSLEIDSKADTFKESTKKLLAPFNSEDLPF